MARIKNVSTKLLIIGPGGPGQAESWLADGKQLVLQPNDEKVMFDEDLEKSPGIKAAMLAGDITKLSAEEPNDGSGVAEKRVMYFNSAASAGGAASEAMTVTGLAVGDEVISVTQSVAGANGTAVNGFSLLIINGLTVGWTADPGAGAIVRVAVLRD